MKKVKQATEIVRLINGLLLGVSIGLAIAKHLREAMNELADNDEFLSRLAKRAAAKGGK